MLIFNDPEQVNDRDLFTMACNDLPFLCAECHKDYEYEEEAVPVVFNMDVAKFTDGPSDEYWFMIPGDHAGEVIRNVGATAYVSPELKEKLEETWKRNPFETDSEENNAGESN